MDIVSKYIFLTASLFSYFSFVLVVDSYLANFFNYTISLLKQKVQPSFLSCTIITYL